MGLIKEPSELCSGKYDSLFCANKLDEGMGSRKLDKLLTKKPPFRRFPLGWLRGLFCK
jgi:hypothetical protein